MRRHVKPAINHQLKTSENYQYTQEHQDYLSPWRNWDDDTEEHYIPTYRKQLLFEYKSKNPSTSYHMKKKQEQKLDAKIARPLHPSKNKIKSKDSICKYLDIEQNTRKLESDNREKKLRIKKSFTEVSGEDLVLAGKQWQGIEGRKIKKPSNKTVLQSKLGDEVVFISRSVDSKHLFSNSDIRFTFQKQKTPLPQAHKKSRNPSKFFKKKKISTQNENSQIITNLNINKKSSQSLQHNKNRKFAMTVQTQVLRQLKQRLTAHSRSRKNSSCSKESKQFQTRAKQQQNRVICYPKQYKNQQKLLKNNLQGSSSIYLF